MILAIINNKDHLHPLRTPIIRSSFVPDVFLDSCTHEMIRAYSHAIESVTLGLAKEMSVGTRDYDRGDLGLIYLECKDRNVRIYTTYSHEDLEEEGLDQVDATFDAFDLYFEMHKISSLRKMLRQAYLQDKSKVFGMDLSKNFEPLKFEQARYFNTDNGESGMVTDLPEGHEWLKRYMSEYGLEYDPANSR